MWEIGENKSRQRIQRKYSTQSTPVFVPMNRDYAVAGRENIKVKKLIKIFSSAMI